MTIPSVVLKPAGKIPITRYGIDRNMLVSAGISSKDVDSIYRSLFVHSLGFFEMLKQKMSNVSLTDKTELCKNIWKVFIILLEYTCRTDYNFAIESIQLKNAADAEDIHLDYKNQLNNLELEK